MRKVFIFTIIMSLFFPLIAYSMESNKSDIIAYSRLTDGYWQIWVRDVKGKMDYQLTKTPVDKRYPDWSPDGKRLIYRTNNGNLFLISSDGNDEKKILTKFENLNNPKWSPDNKRLTFSRYRTDIKDDSDIWISDLNGGNPVMLTNNPGLQYQPGWSPDGKKIIFVSGKEPGRHQIIIMDLSNKSSQPLTDNNYYHMLPAWSPDGEEIAFTANRSGNYDIWIAGSDGGNLRQLTKHKGFDTSPAWSPDGSKIAFVSDRSGNLHIWLMDSDRSNLRQLTRGEIESRDPAWIKGKELIGK